MKLGIAFTVGFLVLSSLAVAQLPTPVAANGQLKVIGRQLCNQAGKPIQLRGMSSHGLQYFPNCFNASSVQALASNWGIDVFRSAMYVDEGGYVTNKSGFRTFVDNLVDWTGQNGVYNIIDWHILNPGNPNDHLADAKEFFQIEAQKHAGKKNVIYEICNEPNGVDWPTIKGYAEQIIPIIRQYDSQAIILVGTPNYSGTPGDVSSNPLTGANAYNVMYTFHFYAGSHYTESYIDGVLKTVPLFISEWGTSNYSGNGGNDYTNSQNWLNLLAGQNSSGIKVSWCNWNFSDNSETSAALNPGSCNSGSWNNTSTSGTWVKDHILNPADDFGPATPSVTLTSSPASTTVAIGTNVVITAALSNTAATSVDFYAGTTRLGGLTTAPYSWTITNIQAGAYSFTAKALLSSGGPLVSSPIQITAAVPANQAPTVILTAPANNTSFTAPATITLTATANDADGSVAKVEFYNGATKLGESTSSPYQFTWAGMGTGTYTLTAKATDNLGATGTSATTTVYVVSPGSSTDDLIGPTCVLANDVKVYSLNASNLPSATSFSWWCTGSTQSITQTSSQASINFGPSFTGGQVCVGVNYSAAPWYKQFCKSITVCTSTPPTTSPNQSPSVAITSPANNATFTYPATVNLVVSASDADGSVAKVEYFTGATKLGETTSAPYQFTWTGMSAGSYAITTKATDNLGATTTSSAVNIQVNNPAPVNQAPTVALMSPVTNATFTAPATINVMVTASDTDGSVTKVEFFTGATKLGESTAAPYQFSWSNVSAGTYSLTAKATDNQGATTTSGVVTIQVKTTPVNQPPTIALTSPVTNATFSDPATVALTAAASDADGVVAKVEFFNGSTKLGETISTPYQLTWTSVSAGTYTLTAKATDNLGAATTSGSVTIQVKTATTTPPTNPTADLIGADCVHLNDVLTFEANARNLTNATNFSWWCTGSTQNITAGPTGKATYSFGPYFTGGQVCVGINYSASPWYGQFCKTVSVCAPGARLGHDELTTTLAFPNPSDDQFSLVVDRDITSMVITDQLGRQQLKVGGAKAGQLVRFGAPLSGGLYLLQIHYEDQTDRVIKLLKVGR